MVHAAYGSIRMEPVFMILGQSAAIAAALALDADGIVQNVKYEQLHAILDQENLVLYVDVEYLHHS
ncbi:FAD-dependent oxidoreductase [Paenibacillus sp. Soil766]|uniref:FAD-dependent oxidoreductase n=1 Tax=Paenibacillus sp. Soil766 TaxID=1736404 RepID=UPI001F3E41C6|nr:FAD-dependent oxidoreductase [Paenibacillus sp. Soil766]